MSYESYLDKQLRDPKFKKEFDEEYFVQVYSNKLLCALEDGNIPYYDKFVLKIEKILRKQYNKNSTIHVDFLLLKRSRGQAVKAAVCKTAIHRFESDRDLKYKSN